jgi:hypothetical protein
MKVVLHSFQGSRAILDLHYGDRHARLELDRMEDRYAGQATEERAREELQRISEELAAWLAEDGNQIQQA